MPSAKPIQRQGLPYSTKKLTYYLSNSTLCLERFYTGHLNIYLVYTSTRSGAEPPDHESIVLLCYG